MTGAKLFTIGHSAHPIEEFIALIKRAGATAIADVRSAPYSRFNPQFNSDTFQAALKKHGIAYVFLGRELGARSDDPSCYENGRVQYGRLARTTLFSSGIQRLIKGAESHVVAVMCAEKEPLDCHRTLLVSRALEAEGASVTHLLADGRREDHDATMVRLIKMMGLPERDLFRSREEQIEVACAMQEERIAYMKDEKTGSER
jgi:uncharacterized protein (DUF488 family)